MKISEISNICRIAATRATLLLVLCACASSPGPGAVKTFHDGSYDGTVFRNFLVISAVGRHDSRALFEKTVATRLADLGTAATAYYVVVGRNQPVRRSFVTDAVRARGFDAVLLTRAPNRDLAVIDPFEFDYDELNQLNDIAMSIPVEFFTELYSASDRKRVWAIRTSTMENSSLEGLVDGHVSQIISQLRKDRLID